MSKVVYFDGNAGVSGNMFVGALLDLGLPKDLLLQGLQQLPVELPAIKIEKVNRRGISATYFEVKEVHEHQHRHLVEIIKMIAGTQLPEGVKELAKQCFTNLAIAEGKIHGVSPEEVGFHEVGAVDAIVDIVGACIGINWLKADVYAVSPLRVGFGTINCAHGEIPLPAPATLELLNGFQLFGGEYGGEWVTPTGAAIIKTLVKSSSGLPALTVEQVGYGAGSREREIPNVFRIIMGKNGNNDDVDHQVILETNIDDMNPEVYGYLGERLLAAGACDYYYVPIYMKKNRPGIMISVLAPPERAVELEQLLFEETTTLGVRRYEITRSCLHRKEVKVEVRGMTIRLKVALKEGKVLKFAPEYEDCRRLARELGVPLRDIYDEANEIGKKRLL